MTKMIIQDIDEAQEQMEVEFACNEMYRYLGCFQEKCDDNQECE